MNDTERKVWRIIQNIDITHSRVTTYQELKIKSGRSKQELDQALTNLVEMKLIFWDKGRTNKIAINRTRRREDKIRFTRMDNLQI